MTDQPEPPAWTPPPPGDRREQLPDAVLTLLPAKSYLSTACDTAQQLEQAPRPTPTSSGVIPDVPRYAERMHARCRLQHKFTGVPCSCPCHQPDDSGPADLTGYLAPDPPIGCLTVTAASDVECKPGAATLNSTTPNASRVEPDRTPSQRPGFHAQLADAIRTAVCGGGCGKTEAECTKEHIQPIVLHHDRIAEVSGSPEQFADVVQALLCREWPWLRAEAEDAAPPSGS